MKRKINLHKYIDEAGGLLAFSIERGEVTASPYSGFNCCPYTGDESESVAECRSLLCSQLGIDEAHFVTAVQTHSTKVAVVERGDSTEGVDAIVTAVPGMLVGVFTADCVAMLLYDEQNGVIAAAHAGWKGTMNNIVGETVSAMLRLGAQTENIRVIFGPSICPKCFEVGDEVVEQFAERGLPVERVMHRNAATGKAHIDLVKSNIYWLECAGIRRENIRESGLCTKCEPERFFSARTLGIKSGRVLTAIMIQKRVKH